MAFNFLVHGEHIGSGDNALDIPYHLKSPQDLSSACMQTQKFLALLAIRNSKPNAYEIQCDSVAVTVDNLKDFEFQQDSDYEIYSNQNAEYIKIGKISPIGPHELSEINKYIPCTEIKLNEAQVNHFLS